MGQFWTHLVGQFWTLIDIKPKQSNKNVDMTVSETPKKVVEVVKVETDKFTYKLYWKVLEYVRLKYPNCFTVPPVPLAIGIHKELINLNILSEDLSPFNDWGKLMVHFGKIESCLVKFVKESGYQSLTCNF